MILSTLAELEEDTVKEKEQEPTHYIQTKEEDESPVLSVSTTIEEVVALTTLSESYDVRESCSEHQRRFYINLRERILVLFEGFQSPNNKNIEAKIDLTLNFLEYLLATIDEELESVDKVK